MDVEVLAQFYPHPLLLLGPPGVGKSETVKRLAQHLASKMNLKMTEVRYSNMQEILQSTQPLFLFYDLRLSEIEPSDVLGLPREHGDGVVFKPPLWVLCFQKHPGIIFLDELTNVQRDDVVSVAYKIIYDRRAGDVEFSPGVWVIAAGNDPEHSCVARELPAPLINRLIVIPFQPPTIIKWAQYMDERGEWDKRTLAYLKMFPGDFIKVPPRPSMLENYPTPRSWTMLATMLTKIKNDEAVKTLSVGCLGREVGEKFVTFLSHPVPSVDELINNPTNFRKLDVDTKYIFTTVLANWLDTEEKIIKAIDLIKIMSEEQELLMLLFMCLSPKLRSKFIVAIKQYAGNLFVKFVDIIRFMTEVRP